MWKMSVLLRKDLPRHYQAVQGGHAVAEILLQELESQKDGISQRKGWNNGTLVYLVVPDEPALLKWAAQLAGLGVFHAIWKEPDLSYQTTALAAVTDQPIFEDLSLF